MAMVEMDVRSTHAGKIDAGNDRAWSGPGQRCRFELERGVELDQYNGLDLGLCRHHRYLFASGSAGGESHHIQRRAGDRPDQTSGKGHDYASALLRL
jgi:hypothetical protein